jgi:sugar phosphate isomerase/epimerase
MALRLGGQPWTLDLVRGPILADHERRALNMRYVEASLARARQLGGESVIVAYDWLPQIRVRLGGKREGSVEYVYLLTGAELADLRGRGVGVYDLAGAEAENVKVNGVSLRESGSRSLDQLE